MDKPVCQNAKVLLERCESGRIGLTANELTWVTGSEGSNPSLSARERGTGAGRPGSRPAAAGLPCAVTLAAPAWCEECARRRGPLLAADPGVSEEPGGLGQARGLPRGAGLRAGLGAAEADLVVVNTCAFIEAARQESIDTVLDLAERRRPGARLWSPAAWPSATATSCATPCPRSTWSPASARPRSPRRSACRSGPRRLSGPSSDRPRAAAPGSTCSSCPRPAARAPWAYVKVAEGCDRICGFCAIPSFRGKQRSRTPDEVLAEVDALVAGGRRRRGGAGTHGRRCARSCSWPRTSPRTAGTAPARAAPAHRATAPRPSPR